MSRSIRFFVFSGLAIALAIGGIYAIGAPDDSEDAPSETLLKASSENAPSEKTSSEASSDTPPDAPKDGVMEDRPVALSEPETKAVQDFEARLNEYIALHQKLEANLDPLSEEASPEDIDEYRTQLRAQIKTARVGAKRGDLFTPGMEKLVKRVCSETFSGKDGQQVKSTIMDENPGKLPDVSVNDRYPDGVPVTTMPAQLLETLPKLQAPVEYRFVGERLVLVDAAAGMVIDFTPDVMP